LSTGTFQSQQGEQVQVRDAGDQRPQLVEACRVGDAEDHLDDDLEGDRLHPLEGDDLLAGLPLLDLAAGPVGDQTAVAPHGATGEGRHQQLPGAYVLLFVQEQQ
jgi:hypothetical protein